jgi:hypothetical protein
MTRTTPAPESSTPCSCPNPHYARCHRPGEGHLAHRSWTGRHQHIARLRCTAGGREGSARAGPLRARSTLPAAPVIRLVPCQRWGVCEEGTAALGGGDLKTGPRCPRVAAPRAQTPHRQSVQPREGQGGHWDEAHATLRPTPVAWGQTAWAMGRGCRLGVDCGPRPRAWPRRVAPRAWPGGGRGHAASRRGGRRRRRRCSRGSGCSSAAAGGAREVARHNRGWWLPTSCALPQWSRAAPRLARWWRAAPGWGAAAPAVWASRCAGANAARRSRRPVGNAGRAPCVGSSPPCGAAPGVGPGAARASGGRSGSWSACTML